MKIIALLFFVLLPSLIFAQIPDSVVIDDPFDILDMTADSSDLQMQIEAQLARQTDSTSSGFELYPRLERADYLVEFRKLTFGEPNPGMTPLMVAAYWGDEANLNKHLERRVLVDQRDYAGFTALMHAVNKGNSTVASALMQKNASIFVKDFRGETLLHKAARSNMYGMIPRWTEEGLMVEVRDKYGVTPLMIAVYQRNFAAAHEILKLSPNPNLRDNFGANCLHWFFTEEVTALGELSPLAKRELGLTPQTNAGFLRFSMFKKDEEEGLDFTVYDWLYLLKKFQVDAKIPDFNKKMAWELIENEELRRQISDAWSSIRVEQ